MIVQELPPVEEHAETSISEIIAEAMRAAEEKRRAKLPTKTPEEIAAEKAANYTFLSWYCTEEQIKRMSQGERAAVDEFFEDNKGHIKNLAFGIMSKLGYVVKYGNINGRMIIRVGLCEVDDFINQSYIELRSGKFNMTFNKRSISHGVLMSMYYAPVGGYPEERKYNYRELRGRKV